MTEASGRRAGAIVLRGSGEGVAALLHLPGLSAVAALGAAGAALLHDPVALRLPAAGIVAAVGLNAGSLLLLTLAAWGFPGAARVLLRRFGRVVGLVEAVEVAACLGAMALRPAWIAALSVALAGLIGLHAVARLALAVRMRSAHEDDAGGDGR